MSTPAERFKGNLISMIDDLAYRVVDKYHRSKHLKLPPALVTLAAKFLNGFQDKGLLEGFVRKSYEFWPTIIAMESDFFVKNAVVIFGGDVDVSLVKCVTDIFSMTDENGNRILLKEDEDLFWPYLITMVRSCIVHVHESRMPIKDGQGKCKYTVDYFPMVNVPEMKKLVETVPGSKPLNLIHM